MEVRQLQRESDWSTSSTTHPTPPPGSFCCPPGDALHTDSLPLSYLTQSDHRSNLKPTKTWSSTFAEPAGLVVWAWTWSAPTAWWCLTPPGTRATMPRLCAECIATARGSPATSTGWCATSRWKRRSTTGKSPSRACQVRPPSPPLFPFFFTKKQLLAAVLFPLRHHPSAPLPVRPRSGRPEPGADLHQEGGGVAAPLCGRGAGALAGGAAATELRWECPDEGAASLPPPHHQGSSQQPQNTALTLPLMVLLCLRHHYRFRKVIIFLKQAAL